VQETFRYLLNPETGDEYPPHPDFGWITDKAGFDALLKDKRIHWPKNPKTGNPRKKRFLTEAAERTPVSSLEIEIKQGEGNRDLTALFGEKLLNFPKPVSVMQTVVDVCCPSNGLVVDFVINPSSEIPT
jgi:adenine-specific DNA-methyltransferase